MVDLTKSILDELTIGKDVRTAYDKASKDVFVTVAESFRAGVSLEDALSRVGVEDALVAAERIQGLGGLKLDIFQYVVVGGELENIPDPACVQARLKKYDKPTREQILDAFKACLKEKG